jgi:hypothetical protein
MRLKFIKPVACELHFLILEGAQEQMATPMYISFHVMLGLLGIGSGFAVMLQFLTGKRLKRLPVLFFARIRKGILTGLILPIDRILPTHFNSILFPLVFLVTMSV